MRNILKAELYKQQHSFQSYLNFIIYILISGACIAFSLLTYNERPVSMVNTLNWLTPIFLTLITATIATIDIENHTLKNLLASGISRKNIYLGKLATALVITLIYVLFSGVMIASGSFFSVAMYGSICGDANVGSLVLRYALEVIAMFMYTLLFFGVSMLFKSNKNAMTVNIIIISV
ncbi:MAG: ABC transporter permease subunit, partial [Acutalibacteraceae bacterium]